MWRTLPEELPVLNDAFVKKFWVGKVKDSTGGKLF